MRPKANAGSRRPSLRWLACLASPTYLIAIALIVFFAVFASGSPTSYFALSLVFASIYITLALAWDLSSGLTGYLNFGLPFFFGLGAFTSGYLVWTGHLRSLPILLVASLGVGLAGGLLFSLPTLRLRGPYFSLLSLLLPLIGTDFLAAFWNQLGMPSPEGFYALPFLGTTPGAELVSLSVVNAVLLTAFFLLRESHFGLILRGIRDDEDALASQGIWTLPYKITVFTVASGVAGFGGATYATVLSYAGLDAFGFTFLLLPILIVILGGLGEISGAVIAGYVVVLIYQYLFQAVSGFTLIVFSGVAILLVLFLPNGILPLLRSFIRFMRTPEAP